MKKKLLLFLTFLMIAAGVCTAYAEEDGYYEENYEESYEEEEEETEFIPEEYYAPVETNELPGWPQGSAVQAASAVVMDLDTNAFLYSKNMYAKMYPASITKIMTTMIALERGNLDDEITFSEIVYDIEENSSHQGIQPGETLTLRQALYGLMLESANDIGNGLAEYFGGSISGFADLMNEKAAELGCVNTHFANPHGLHNENHYTCAYDMALIAQAAYEIPEFRKIASTTLEECPETNLTEETRYFVNHHKMLQEESDYYRSWVTGGKTGYTSDARNTLVTYGEKDGKRLVCVLLHDNGAGRCYLETADLMNYGFNQFKHVEIAGKEYPTFYEAMNSAYVGRIYDYFQADELKKKIAEQIPGIVTIPVDFSLSDLTVQGTRLFTPEKVISGKLSYRYGDWTLGSSGYRLTPLPQEISLSYERELDMDEILKRSSSNRRVNEIEQTAITVMENTQVFLENTYGTAKAYIEKNTLTVAAAGSVVLLVLIILIIILILRCTRESRMRRRRIQEEKERLRREEQIDRMTTSEIEQELREAMAREQEARAREQARLEEQRKAEEKLRETEQILEEIGGKNKN